MRAVQLHGTVDILCLQVPCSAHATVDIPTLQVPCSAHATACAPVLAVCMHVCVRDMLCLKGCSCVNENNHAGTHQCALAHTPCRHPLTHSRAHARMHASVHANTHTRARAHTHAHTSGCTVRTARTAYKWRSTGADPLTHEPQRSAHTAP